ncbi:MAG: thioredoxin family protein [Aeromicrobium sp.]|uniref:TlpA family protein disulfide reductase n=1 Tax=Aeromicrobium sp. TaxID=1871063 RepID=UPI0025BBFE50|nr:thioredoxin family protein [Aeromicrobium sp.]MCK5891416.1 thioredoxin family protein [Aeromicrobium sp.]MDF1704438.1 thioredoxin family protein [Aeromicrobium sp.]
MIGVWVLLGAVVLAVVVAAVKRALDGRFRTAGPEASSRDGDGDGSQLEVLTPAEIGGELGARLTFVQFSSSFCSPCRATRTLLGDVVRTREGVEHVEVDAESNLELVRRLNILRTPTVLVVDPAGVVVGRASGLPRREQIEAVLASVGG